MDTILVDTSRSALRAAVEENIFALFDLFKQWPQAELHDTPELLFSVTNIQYPLFNSVLRARLASDAVKGTIESILAEYKSRNLPVMWWTGPSTQPPDLGTYLSERGFQASANPGMAANLKSLPESYPVPENLVIKRVETEEELYSWSRVLADVFGNPGFVADAFFDFCLNLGFDSPFINYIGSIDNQVVATSSLFLGGGVAGIYDVATVEGARRKGIGAALTAIPLLEARSAGYRVGTLDASESGYNVYRKLGFEEVCKITRHIWEGDP